ncbi:unnamed protein product [Heterobilharzia americana]|nr:unnamed protein product [Heterobilharzia americana]
MTQMFSIDHAVKSVVEFRERQTTRRIYRRRDLLRLRNSPQTQVLPPDFDIFSKIKTEVCSDALSGVVNVVPRRHNECSKIYRNIFNSTLRSSVKRTSNLIELYDSAIVRAQKKSGETTLNNEVESRKDSDYSAKYHASMRQRSRLPQKPEWYVHGPSVVEDHVGLQEYNMFSGDDEKENKLSYAYISQTDLSDRKPADQSCKFSINSSPKCLFSVKELEEYLKSLLLQNSKRDHGIQEERSLNIKTLREIESELKITPAETNERCDMKAFGKLLNLFGHVSVPYYVTSQKQKEEKTCTNNPCHSDISHDKKNILNIGCADSKQPDVSGSCLSNLNITTNSGSTNQPFPSMSRKANIKKTDVAAHVNCNPLTAPYQRQFIASGPLGQNALRWFKAMTNAASANACINQHLETFKNLCSKRSETVTTTHLSEVSPSYSLPSYQTSFTKSYCYHNERANQSVNPFPHHFRIGQPSLGFRFPSSSIRSMLMSSQLQNASFLSGPTINPFILQQLIQKQIDFRSAVLQLPFDYFRTQFSNISNGNIYSAFSQSSSTDVSETKNFCLGSTLNNR